MLTFIFLGAGVLLVIGLVILAMRSGMSGGRHAQSGEAEVIQQEQNSSPRGGTRASGSAND